MRSARAKSWFILPAVVASALVFLVSALLALTGGQERLAWWGATFAALPLPFIVLKMMSRPRPREPESAPLALLVASAGTLLAAWEWLIERTATWPPFATAVAALCLLLLYVFWYSRFGRFSTGRFDVGGKLPEFSVRDLDGNTVSSRDFLGSPAVFLFYRGNWCPVCMGQVAEIAARREDFERLGVAVALISPQSAEKTRKLAASLDVPFRFLVDENNEAARELDIELSQGVPTGMARGYHPDTVMPTVVVTNANGTIVFSDETDSYRVRPEPDMFLAILKRSGAIAE